MSTKHTTVDDVVHHVVTLLLGMVMGVALPIVLSTFFGTQYGRLHVQHNVVLDDGTTKNMDVTLNGEPYYIDFNGDGRWDWRLECTKH